MKRYLANTDSLSYDQTFNLLYLIKNYLPIRKKTSLIRKEQQEDKEFSNLFIWDINTKQKSKVFSDEIAQTEQVQKIIFEKDYNEKEQRIVFNIETQLLNYHNVPFRHPKNNLLIETYHRSSEKHHLWLCDKQGKGLQKIASLSSNTQWHLDVGNHLIRMITHSKTDIDVQEITW